MAISPGTRLGPYEVLSPLGQGGMGEVYRARDTRLDRIVAIKILPAGLGLEPESRRRLQVEARAVSSLNHPNICTLFDIGSHEDIDFLVMELLDGETLADRLRRGPIPFEQLLRIAIEITRALDAAHAHGVIHRDLKPSNVMLTKAGAKLLDFGVAKVRRPGTPIGIETGSLDAPATAEGVVLGTLQYMAPEQLEGEEVDARADVFSLGAVLYEMATGRKAFEGKTQASLTAAILEREPPPPSSVRGDIPLAFDRFVRRCLAKDPSERWQSARDILFHLMELAERTSDGPAAAGRPRTGLARGAAAISALIAIGALGLLLTGSSTPGTNGTFHISLPAGTAMVPPEAVNTLALSPDGSQIAFTASRDGRNNLWVRPLNSLDARPLPGTEDARLPFWSPDSQWIGFSASGKLQRVDPTGGPPQVICEAPLDTAPTWSPDGTILFAMAPDASSKRAGGIYRVSADGGPITQVTTVDPAKHEAEHYWPTFLPDGNHFLFLATIVEPGTPRRHTAYVGSTSDRTVTRVDDLESRMMYAPPGFVVYAEGGALLGRRFDLDTYRFAGDPFPIADRLWYYKPTGLAQFSVSNNGRVVYHGGPAVSELIWYDRAGRELGRLGSRASFNELTISPDGNQIAVAVVDPKSGSADIWIYDRESGIPTRFGTDEASRPVWSSDGRWLYFRTFGVNGGPPDIFKKRSDAGGARELVVGTDGVQSPTDASLDGRHLVYVDANRLSGHDLWLLRLSGSETSPTLYLRTAAFEQDASFSPDGRWIAFVSSQSGKGEIYVAPIDDPGARRRVSIAGGLGPRWRRDGRELVYLDLNDTVMAVAITTDREMKAGTPRALFSTGPVARNPGGGFGEPFYDLAPDGQTFLVNRIVEDPGTAPMTVVLDWPAVVQK